ncbi:hypothetical protein QCE63_29085 [Caballeronia sp. LZ065]|uniref:hypothetical protein n=1 Tax=Caballeronia sp. LZ065 TaxID=3038571 RepID=UPI00285CCD6F|nr:hypothetical protein [Caballeronia sp. LZ065]MDR5783473.1 hypothetical protein [Caballeronia sp. LZ065]
MEDAFIATLVSMVIGLRVQRQDACGLITLPTINWPYQFEFAVFRKRSKKSPDKPGFSEAWIFRRLQRQGASAITSATDAVSFFA